MNFGRPNPQLAVVNYRSLARDYDGNSTRIASIREENIALLGIPSGERVLDVASGTGLSFPNLRTAVGNDGYVTGIELSPVMCELARQRMQSAGWQNVSVVEGSALSAEIATASTAKFDAVLFHYTHDVLRQPDAVRRLLALCMPGARVALAGFKGAPSWAAPFTGIAMWRGRRYLTTYEGIAALWSHLAPMLVNFKWQSRLLGTGYAGWGHLADEGPNL